MDAFSGEFFAASDRDELFAIVPIQAALLRFVARLQPDGRSESQPDITSTILQYRGNSTSLQAAGCDEVLHLFSIVPADSGASAEPDATGTILQHTADDIAILSSNRN